MAASTKPPRKNDQIVSSLAVYPDVVPVSGRPGQVLLYARHVPTGVYVVLAGVVRRDANRLLDAARGAFLVPSIEDLEKPAQATFTIVRDAELLFIPRSLALHDQTMRTILDHTGLAGRPSV